MKTCLIIGAGISGLLAAHRLNASGVEVTLVDKGRGVGGRMATRRIGEAVFDHGAQFFTVRDAEFAAEVERWIAGDAAAEWCHGFLNREGVASTDGHPRYRGTLGMTTIPKLLAQGLNIRTCERILSISADAGGWKAISETGAEFTADALILTSPVPQSLALLDAGEVDLPDAYRQQLEAVRYDPCLALMLRPTQSLIPSPGAIQFEGEPISWIADNQRKGISPVPAITVHAAPQFSKTHWDTPTEEVTTALLEATGRWFEGPTLEAQLHRWRYAKPEILHPAPGLMSMLPHPVVFCGDAFGTPRVEGAALSGMYAAEQLLELGA